MLFLYLFMPLRIFSSVFKTYFMMFLGFHLLFLIPFTIFVVLKFSEPIVVSHVSDR